MKFDPLGKISTLSVKSGLVPDNWKIVTMTLIFEKEQGLIMKLQANQYNDCSTEIGRNCNQRKKQLNTQNNLW